MRRASEETPRYGVIPCHEVTRRWLSQMTDISPRPPHTRHRRRNPTSVHSPCPSAISAGRSKKTCRPQGLQNARNL
jgi:hypothetical protein